MTNYEFLLQSYIFAFYKALLRHGCVRCKGFHHSVAETNLTSDSSNWIYTTKEKNYLVFLTNKTLAGKTGQELSFFLNVNFS